MQTGFTIFKRGVIATAAGERGFVVEAVDQETGRHLRGIRVTRNGTHYEIAREEAMRLSETRMAQLAQALKEASQRGDEMYLAADR